MTMHLLRGMSTLNTRKPTFKLTKSKEASWREDLAIYNRELKRRGEERITWEQYLNMRLGKTKASNSNFKPLTSNMSTHPRYVDRVQHESLGVVAGNTLKREPLKYTGTLVKGIATMHKSNAVPVIDEEQMKDISRMRRG
jgi:hypothetical protein